jgi:hypothetical protein
MPDGIVRGGFSTMLTRRAAWGTDSFAALVLKYVSAAARSRRRSCRVGVVQAVRCPAWIAGCSATAIRSPFSLPGVSALAACRAWLLSAFWFEQQHVLHVLLRDGGNCPGPACVDVVPAARMVPQSIAPCCQYR